MVQVTAKTQPQLEAALTWKVYSGSKERAELIEAIFRRGSLSVLLRVSHFLNSKEAQGICVAYEHIMHYTVATQLLAIFPKSKGYMPLRDWLVSVALKAPMKFLMDKRQTLHMENSKDSVWWPRVALKRRAEIDEFFKQVTTIEEGKYTLVLSEDSEFFKLLTEKQKKIVMSAN